MVTERTPAHRGLLPDYYVPVSFNEVYCDTNDIVLENTLEITSQGRYINHQLFVSENGVNRKESYIVPLLCFLLFLSIFSIKKGTNK